MPFPSLNIQSTCCPFEASGIVFGNAYRGEAPSQGKAVYV